MALTLSQTGIAQTQTINAWHVTQSVDAFTGTQAYDITISGSFGVTGSSTISGSLITIGSQTASGSLLVSGSSTISGSLRVAGSSIISGSLTVTGSVLITGSLAIVGGVYPSSSPTSSINTVYGTANNKILGEPDAWLTVYVDGGTYYMPLFG